MSNLNDHKNILVSTETIVKLSESGKSYVGYVSFSLQWVSHNYDLSSLEHSTTINHWLMDGLKTRLLYFSEFGKEGNEMEILEFLKKKITDVSKKKMRNSGE